MVFTEQDLNIGINPFDILNEATYVNGDALISPITVPMVENSNIGGIIVRFSDVEALSESYGCDYIDAMIAIAEENNVDPNYLAVAVDEAEIILNPYIITELANIVIIPMRDDDPRYELCEQVLYEYYGSYPINEISDNFIDKMLTGNTANRRYKSFADKNSDMETRRRLANMLKITNKQLNPKVRLEMKRRKEGLTPFQQKQLSNYSKSVKLDMDAMKDAAKYSGKTIRKLLPGTKNEYYITRHPKLNTVYSFDRENFKNNKKTYTIRKSPSMRLSNTQTMAANTPKFLPKQQEQEPENKYGWFARWIGKHFGAKRR